MQVDGRRQHHKRRRAEIGPGKHAERQIQVQQPGGHHADEDEGDAVRALQKGTGEGTRQGTEKAILAMRGDRLTQRLAADVQHVHGQAADPREEQAEPAEEGRECRGFLVGHPSINRQC